MLLHYDWLHKISFGNAHEDASLSIEPIETNLGPEGILIIDATINRNLKLQNFIKGHAFIFQRFFGHSNY